MSPCGGMFTTAEAFARFDALPPVEIDDLLGSWTGESVPTGHPLDGALEPSTGMASASIAPRRSIRWCSTGSAAA